MRNKIVALLRLSKNNHLRDFFTKNSNDIKNTWKGIKSIISIRENSYTIPSSMIMDNKNESDPGKIAEGFNSYFSSIAEKLE